MYLFNVTVGIDKDVEAEWLRWMKAEHIPRVMNTGLFLDHKVYKVLHDQGEGSTSYSIQYFAESIDHVNRYFERFAQSLLDEQRTRFRDKHVAFMTLLEEI